MLVKIITMKNLNVILLGSLGEDVDEGDKFTLVYFPIPFKQIQFVFLFFLLLDFDICSIFIFCIFISNCPLEILYFFSIFPVFWFFTIFSCQHLTSYTFSVYVLIFVVSFSRFSIFFMFCLFPPIFFLSVLFCWPVKPRLKKSTECDANVLSYYVH